MWCSRFAVCAFSLANVAGRAFSLVNRHYKVVNRRLKVEIYASLFFPEMSYRGGREAPSKLPHLSGCSDSRPPARILIYALRLTEALSGETDGSRCLASLKALPRSIGSPRLMYRKNKNPFCNEKRLERSILVRKMASVKLKLHSFGSKNQLFGEGSSRNAIRKPSAALLFRTLPPDPRSRGSDQ